jgi:hypothetical protein
MHAREDVLLAEVAELSDVARWLEGPAHVR